MKFLVAGIGYSSQPRLRRDGPDTGGRLTAYYTGRDTRATDGHLIR